MTEYTSGGPPVQDMRTDVFTIPTDQPESDGTLPWNKTTLVVVRLRAADTEGLGYTYSHASAARIINDLMKELVVGADAFDVAACQRRMFRRVRNIGQTGLTMMALAAVDSALWDLKARLLRLPLVKLLGQMQEKALAYGSGGFTSYNVRQLQQQLGGWAQQNFQYVKMKIGRQPADDPKRMQAARQAIGPDVKLMVDANGAYGRKEAVAMAQLFGELGIVWYEQPVFHYDLEGLRQVRESVAPTVEVTSGEYGFELDYIQCILRARAVDVLQLDATRCGMTGFLEAAVLCRAAHIPLSSHCAPSIHLHLCCALENARHMEYFHDHVRIEQMLFDGAAVARDGYLTPDLTRPGMGLILKDKDAAPYRQQ